MLPRANDRLAAQGAGAADEQYLLEYQAYDSALKAGDKDAAVRHAFAAWEAAEAALGGHRLTAILAFNYGRLIVFGNAEQAVAPLQRVLALHEAGIADPPAGMVQVYSGYAAFAASEYKRRNADRLRASLEALGTDAAGADPDLAVMWLQLATGDVAAGRYLAAVESAAAAEAAILSAAPGNSRGLASAIMLGAVARLVPTPRDVDEIQAAHNELSRAFRLFPPQKDIDSFDPLLAKVLAWNYASGSALTTLGYDDYPDHEVHAFDDEQPLLSSLFEQDENTDCGEIEWLEREAPRYPPGALRHGSIGAVLVGYRLGSDLTVQDARILAEVPAEGFGKYALKAVKNWRAKALPSGGPSCYRNLTACIRFVMDY